ncbi:MAG TPA: heme-binding protein [Thermomicrobiales bacterium]|nr:heme-binding protein [Thermomicrobiales bacterium]
MTRRIAGIRAAMIALVMAVSGLTAGVGMAQSEEVEQPPYEVIDQVGPVEIREYGPRLAAEADMGPGSGVRDGQYSAFMVLADFIFANNREGPSVAMTAPVAIEQGAEPIAMTAPVAVEPGEAGQVMRFFMPAEYSMETLPRPGDERVRIVTVPAQTLAVLQFSGDTDDAEFARRTAELLAGLQGSAWQPTAEPGFFGYDPPMTPPDLRRNEVFVEVAAVGATTPD